MNSGKRSSAIGIIVFGAAWIGTSASAQEACTPVVGQLVSAEGEVEVRRAGDTSWRPADLDETLCEEDSVRTGRRSRAAIALINEAVLRLDQNTTTQLLDIAPEPEEQSLLSLIAGAFQSFSRRPRRLAISTPYMNATIEGTEFVIRANTDAEQSELTVFEGVVAAANDLGEVRVAAGESVVAEAGEAPQPRVVVRPRDAVQWALYYPPILAAVGGQADAADLPPVLAEATRRASEGDVDGAFEVLDDVPDAERGAQYHVYRAGLLLSVGRVDEAREAIDRALAQDPNAGLAYAQRAIIELVQNQEDEALATARRAVELSPEATAPEIALSYAQQANFQLEAARDTLSHAVEQQPEDALAWARLSELWLMLGHRGRAREAADRAVALAPDIERTQITRGFADLVEFRTGPAKEAFQRAIELAPGDPLPRLGLGLAQIREGDLEEGRRNLEVAVGLDSSDALLRAYLGKAYFEEKRNDIANEQYAIAQELDPLDPTAYLYEAIKQQTENRPGEALQSLQRSIELNDNRAVYRSRLLLDSDRAARGTSLARIYDDLGFQDLGVLEASRSLALDPTNASAHRFLSDAYGGVRRRESARVSELLQAQMLQDININPVQPSLSETNLNIVTQGGPADAGFNEFTPLFERQQAQLNATGVAGNNETYGGEGVVSMLYDRYSLSAGAFHYRSDGWRPNHDIEHDIQNVFFQTAITPELNAQVELRRRQSELGDLALNFDPDVFFPNFGRDTERDLYRAGLRYSPTPNSDLLLSLSYTDVDDAAFDIIDTPDGVFDVDAENQDNGYQLETQYLYRRDRVDLVAGAGFSSFDLETNLVVTLDGAPFFEEVGPEDLTQIHPYVYGHLNFPDPVVWTLGVSYDDIDRDIETGGGLSFDEVNPKLGVQWFVTDDLVLRAAAFQYVKPLLTSDQTLEPTEIAGFNQLFDDRNWVTSRRYGAGLDWRVRSDLFVGMEGTLRELDVPFVQSGVPNQTFDWDEQRHRVYVNWVPLSELALSVELVYDRFDADGSVFTVEGEVPERVESISLPVRLRYFHDSGFFAGFGASYVHQEVERSSDNVIGLAGVDGDDNFLVLDASVGYRLPKRLGVVSLQVANILDNGFHYQDDSFREFGDKPSIGPYIPERQILGRLTLNW